MEWLALSAVLVTGMAVFDFHGIMSFLNMNKFGDIGRMSASGLFGDPNDMSFLLVQNMLSCLYLATRPGASPLRWLWLAPLVFLGYGLALTQSRGGLMALLGASGTYLLFRYGRRAVPVGAVVLPVLLGFFGGRQTELDVGGGTGQARLHLWDVYWSLFRGNPLLGIGCGNSMAYSSHVAHNSFLSAYAELGFFGGSLFLGAFVLALWELWRVRPARVAHADPQMAHLLPFLAGGVAAYVFGMISLSRTYAIPTYNILGLALAYLSVVQTSPPRPQARLDARTLQALGLVSLLCLICHRVLMIRNLSYY